MWVVLVTRHYAVFLVSILTAMGITKYEMMGTISAKTTAT
ncbi:hypothetical protein PLUTE_b0219 [Pseudoalteromonas luteoviolacea DSM 6061]|nr:hypothetical protein [Pseudoalteromonas luteoviolacea DSM 6061]